MVNVQDIIEKVKPTIDRNINLVFCRDHKLDNYHRWFYRRYPQRYLNAIRSFQSPEDLRQDILLHVFETCSRYEDRSFRWYVDWFRIDISRHVQDKLDFLMREWKAEFLYCNTSSITVLPYTEKLDLRWLLLNQKVPLTVYERYLAFLYLHREYTVGQIANLMYQDRSTIGDSLCAVIAILKKYYQDSPQ